MYRTFHLQHQQPAQKAMGALGITLRILKNLKPDPFCLFLFVPSFYLPSNEIRQNHIELTK
ncbi:MAG: hypothetical protein KBG39_09695 [Opitutaceae bacterium]|nr:hypothetical protein [Opitutaceae bacterium]